MEARTRAFIIQKMPYEENSILVKALLQDRGKCHFFLSKKNSLPDLCEVELSYRVSPNAKVKPYEWHVLDPLLFLRDDWDKLSCALEWSKALLSLPEDFCDLSYDQTSSIYEVFRIFLKELEKTGPYNSLRVLFYLKILQLEGLLSWAPSSSNPLFDQFTLSETLLLQECFNQKKFSALHSLEIPSEWVPKMGDLFSNFMKR